MFAINDNIKASFYINGKEFLLDQGNVLQSLHISSSTRYKLPVMEIQFVDVLNIMPQYGLQDSVKMQVVIEIPKEVLYDTKQTIEQATDFAKRATALGFYKQYGVSVELCSQIAGMMEKEFIDYLEENGVSVWK
jgi:hypothetical protein